MTYEMAGFLRQSVDSYLELCDEKPRLWRVSTPFLPSGGTGDGPSDEDGEGATGTLSVVACSVLMKLLYAARMLRFDLLRAVGGLASKVSKWTLRCDRELHRLMCYVHSTLDLTLRGHVGDCGDALSLSLFADADFAGDLSTRRSTSGAFVALVGPHTHFPLSARSVKQSCVSHSTPEAEIVAANMAVRVIGLPSLSLWDAVLCRGCG